MTNYGNSLAVQCLGFYVLSLPWAWVRSLVEELRSHKPAGQPKKKDKGERLVK